MSAALVKASPMDFLRIVILKDCGDLFGPIIPKLVNLSFADGKFAEMFILLLKKPGADTNEMPNFQPITNLDTFGKILERLALKQLRRYLEGCWNIGPLQWVYRDLHCIETAMTKVVSDLLTAADSKFPSVLLSLDISAPFDTLDHHRLQRLGLVTGYSIGYSRILLVVNILSQWMVSDHQPLSSSLLCRRDRFLNRSSLLFALRQW